MIAAGYEDGNDAAQLRNDPVVAISPDLSALYARQIADLVAALNPEDTRHEAIALLRRLITKVVITPVSSAPNGIAHHRRPDSRTPHGHGFAHGHAQTSKSPLSH